MTPIIVILIVTCPRLILSHSRCLPTRSIRDRQSRRLAVILSPRNRAKVL
jgi:hypothetical protein